MERVSPVRRLPKLRLAGPSASPEPVVVRAAPVAEHVALGDAHEHAGARQGRQGRGAVHQGVDERVVVPRGGRRAHDAPQGRQALARLGAEVVGGHPVRAQEVRVHHDEAPDPGTAVRQLPLRGGGGAHRHVVRDVGARALPAQVQAGEVGVARDPRVAGGGGGSEVGVGDDPGKGVPGVSVGSGDGVLGGEAVLDGDDEGGGEAGEGVEVGVEDGVEGGADAEAAAVVVDENGELGVAVAVAEAREVEARGDVGGDDDVPGGDAGGGVRGGGDELGAEVALHAVLVDADAGQRLVDQLVVRRGRRRGDGRGGHRRRSEGMRGLASTASGNSVQLQDSNPSE